MKNRRMARRRFAFFWLALLGVGWMVSASMVVLAEDAVGGSARFAQLDADAEQLLNAVAELGAEMSALEEARELSPKSQLLVLVSMDAIPFFQLDAVQLQIDEHTASFHQYTPRELAALQEGGSHRLFWDNVPAGRHQLTLSMMGRVPKDPDFQRQAALVTITGVGRRVVELRVTAGKSQPFPELALKEWK